MSKLHSLEACILTVGFAASKPIYWFTEGEVVKKAVELKIIEEVTPKSIQLIRNTLSRMYFRKRYVEKPAHTQKLYILTQLGVEKFREFYSAEKDKPLIISEIGFEQANSFLQKENLRPIYDTNRTEFKDRLRYLISTALQREVK
jgi:hypothetical protein